MLAAPELAFEESDDVDFAESDDEVAGTDDVEVERLSLR